MWQEEGYKTQKKPEPQGFALAAGTLFANSDLIKVILPHLQRRINLYRINKKKQKKKAKAASQTATSQAGFSGSLEETIGGVTRLTLKWQRAQESTLENPESL